MIAFLVQDEDFSEIFGPKQIIKFAKDQSEELDDNNLEVASLEQAEQILKQRGFEVIKIDVY